MSNPLKEEVLRFKKLFINYGKVIVGGMLLSGIFLCLYAGIRANYVSIIVLTAVISTISLSLLMLFLYVRFHERRWTAQHEPRSTPEALTERDGADYEELRRLIVETISRRPSSEAKTSQKPTLLVSVFQWGHLVGKVFYYGLSTVKLETGLGKGPKEFDKGF